MNVFGIAVGIALFVSISAVSAAYKDAARQPFKNIGADLIVQRTEKLQAQPDKRIKSMRGIRPGTGTETHFHGAARRIGTGPGSLETPNPGH